MSYGQLKSEEIVRTIATLKKRIRERFPESGLSKVCEELEGYARDSSDNIVRISKPLLFLRIGAGAVIFLAICVAVWSIMNMDIRIHSLDAAELVQVMEASINDIVLIGAAIYFLFSIETRFKRSRVLKSIHELRAIAHVIDMHQLTKDPSALTGKKTSSSPKRTMSHYELIRYLDYCSEMLSLTSKVAALYAQAVPDEVVLENINDVEAMTTGLSRKIWQKIMLVKGMETTSDQ